MIDNAWIELTPSQRTVLLEALSSIRAARRFPKTDIDKLTIKLVHSEPHPKITVGVYRGSCCAPT